MMNELNPERSNIQTQDIEMQPLLGKNRSSLWHNVKKHKMKMAAGLSVVNGILFYAIAEAGVKNIGATSDGIKIAMYVFSVGSSLCYTMFFYKTLESLSLLPKNISEGILIILAPFAASPYLSAGIEGSGSFLFIPPAVAIGIGIALFGLRIISCVDGSTKLPNRLVEMKLSWQKGWQEKNIIELSRLTLASVASLGYSIATTDAIYNSAQKILSLFNVDPNGSVSQDFAYTASALGAIGIFPMTLYWIHRGLKQLTGGGTPNENGVIADPTDRYTFFALPIVSSVIIGTIGSATGTNGHVFGKLGLFATVVRLGSSTIYATCGATPGISTLLRGIFKREKPDMQAGLRITKT